ncbi:sal-like protein 3 [Drosophila obscura]|uniref:sal-like protein 3 n=1 Tax=Drosophila obscura TaxID=7282 RepID=UPI001BB0DBF0|nr:sal-like protein 3 [Drosophila obscura]
MQQMLVILSLGLMVACTGAMPAVGPALFPAAPGAAPFGVFPGSAAAAPFAAYTNGQFGVPFGVAGVPFGAAAFPGAPFGAAAPLVNAPLGAAPLAVSSSQRLDYFNQFNAAFGPPAAGRLLAAGPAGIAAPFAATRLIQPARLIAPGSFFF